MKKLIVLILVAICWVNNLYSQQATFSKVLFDADCNSSSKVYSVIASFDSCYILVGYKENQGIILKVDSKGDAVWEKQIGDPDVIYFPFIQLKGVVGTIDSCFIISGYTCTENCGSTNALCIKISNNGDMLWAKTYNYAQASGFTSIQQTQDSGYVMIGNLKNEEKILVSKINSAGDLVWTNILQAGNHSNSAYSIKEYIDGSFIITGYAENGPPFTFHPFIMKLSPTGALVWAKQYISDNTTFGTINDIELTSDGFLVHSYNSNYTVILATDSIGNIKWNKLYHIPTNNLIGGSIPKIHKTQDNAFVFINQLDYWLSHVVKIDSLGNIIWDKEMSIDPIDVIETSYKEYFIPGNRLEIALPSQASQSSCLADIGLMQIDSMGIGIDCVNPGNISTSVSTLSTDTLIFSSSTGGTSDTISLTIYSELSYNSEQGCAFHASGGRLENNQVNIINVYPNPSGGIINLTLEDNKQGQLIVFNSLGERIYTATINGQSTEIDLCNRSNGIYFFKLILSNGKYLFGKFIIRK